MLQQFDVVSNPSQQRNRFPYLVVLQSDILSDLAVVVVAPLLALGDGTTRKTRLNPVVEVDGTAYIVMTELCAAIERSSVKPAVGSVAHHRAALIAGIDMLFTGL
jgi:toxin CcdB